MDTSWVTLFSFCFCRNYLNVMVSVVMLSVVLLNAVAFLWQMLLLIKLWSDLIYFLWSLLRVFAVILVGKLFYLSLKLLLKAGVLVTDKCFLASLTFPDGDGAHPSGATYSSLSKMHSIRCFTTETESILFLPRLWSKPRAVFTTL